MGVELDLLRGRDPRVETIWRELEAEASTYFLSWGWVETWLTLLPPGDVPELAVVRDNGRAIAACFLARRRVMQHHLLPSRVRFLNASGVERFDELTIEHNRVLGTASFETLLALLPRDWDELVMPGLDRDVMTRLPGWPWRVIVDREVPSPYVDLARVRAADGGYLALLGSNTRSQIRRARRAAGEIVLERATSVEHALAIYSELVELHGASWRARGCDGAFADPWIDAFHRRLITDRFATGELDLLRVRAGDHTIGCLYNHVWHGRVTYYQSGLAPAADPRDKPGYICHAAAIEEAAAAGHDRYDFLGGDTRYKQNLATDQTHLAWVRVQRPLVRFAVEERLRDWRRAVRQAQVGAAH